MAHRVYSVLYQAGGLSDRNQRSAWCYLSRGLLRAPLPRELWNANACRDRSVPGHIKPGFTEGLYHGVSDRNPTLSVIVECTERYRQPVPRERPFDILPMVEAVAVIVVGGRIGDHLSNLRVTVGHLVA